jgi:hypothetical protein
VIEAMARHDELLEQGPREAPEPETAEQRSKRVGWGAAAGGVLGGGLALAKLGGLAKVLLWLVAWHAAVDGWRVGSWVGLAVVLLAIATLALVRARREAQ